MKKPALVLIVALLAELLLLGSVQLGQVKASETVGGIIISDTTWTKTGGPYTFTGPVAVNQGVTLTIEAGTIVNIDTYYLQVDGNLQVLGSQNSPVQFKGGQIIFTDVANGWDDQSTTGAKIENAAFTFTNLSSSVSLKIINSQINGDINVIDTSGKRSVFSNNNITGNISVHGSQSIIFSNQVVGSIDVSGSTVVIQNNVAQGISFDGDSIVVCGNTVSNGNGINAHTEDSAVIERNLIYNNTNGIHCSSTGITITNNTIKDNKVGIYMENSAPTISYNNIQNNNDSIYLTGAGNVEATDNFWGTSDQLKIGYSIHDFYDDSNLGKVNYLPALATANSQALPDPNGMPPEMKLNEMNQNQTYSILNTLAASGVVAALIIAGVVLFRRRSKHSRTNSSLNAA